MRIVLITQNEPFYLAKSLKYFLGILPGHHEIVGCVVSDVSPFGKKETFFSKAKKTYRIFGLRFFTYYAVKYVLSKFGNQNRVLTLLKRNNIPTLILEKPINDCVSVEEIRSLRPDLLISILGNQIFKKPILELATKGCINLHTALLPKYRGLMPTFWVLKNQELETGVSVFFMDEGIDSGPIIVQKRISTRGLTQEDLIRVSKRIGMDAIVEAVELIGNDDVEVLSNDEAKKTYFSFPTAMDVSEFRRVGAKFF